MAGELVPLVVFRKFTTLTGASAFTSVALEAREYSKALLSVWRGPVLNSGSVEFDFEESTDQQTWATCSGTTPDWDPGASSEGQVSADLKRRWFRVKATVYGTAPSVTCWAVGFLERREK